MANAPRKARVKESEVKLCRLRRNGAIIPAIALGDTLHDVSSLGDFTPSFLEHTLPGLTDAQVTALPVIGAHDGFAPCVPQPSKLVCVGLNYHDHAREVGMEPPSEPVLFFKAPSAIAGPNDPILLPPGSEKLDWEVELAMVIGRRARHVGKEDALSHVAGFTVLNDLSERAYQLERGGQWNKGKSYDSFAPIGPYLVTNVADPGNLHLTLSVNGEVMQDGSTRDFIFDLATVISYISRFMTLEVGDIITTGTPAGVGVGMTPQRFLKVGDKLRTEIEGLGVQEQTVVKDEVPE
jgi:2-keto-4-pentenoate hydratase/2-oxohepta-3-ene-1,7-dioic acid hydratase in catechol pathway